MSFQLTAKAKALSEQNKVEPQIILDIDGIPIIFGATPVLSLWRLDEGFHLDMGLRLDSPTQEPHSRDYISLEKTTKNITQVITPDKSGVSSVSSVSIELVDKNQELSELFAFGNNVDDILSRDATVYLTFKGASHPVDSIPVFRGYIDDYKVGNGSINISVAHPENKKRAEIFNQYQDNLVNAIDDTQTIIDVISTGSLIQSADILTTYIKIDDEIMNVLSFTDTNITVGRGQLNTIQTSHDVDAEVVSIYRLVSDPIDMLLKLYLSDGKQSFFGEESIKSINQVNTNTFIQNAVNFGELDAESEYGLIVGDTIRINNSLEPLNDGQQIIKEFGSSDGNYYIICEQGLITVEQEETATSNFKSQYNILSEGLGLTPREVDIQGHLDVDNFNPNTFPILDFRLEDQIEGKDFCEKEIMFPVSLYSIPRKARISLKLVQPPLTLDETVVLNETTITNIKELTAKRSVNRFLYNQIVYKYEKLVGTDKYLRGRIVLNEDSSNRIKAGRKQLTITSDGLRYNPTTESLLTRQTQRLFDRYKFAAQQVENVEVLYSTGFIEIGDVVVFGGNNVQLMDLNTGKRVFEPRLMEVVNRSLNFVNGRIKLTLLETAFGLNARYGVVSPSSIVGENSTNKEIRVITSYGSQDEFVNETDKWQQFVNQRIRVRSEDYDYDEIGIIAEIKPSDRSVIVLKEPLSFVPTSEMVVEIPDYDDSGLDKIYKDIFTFNVAQVLVTNVIDNISFEVDRPDDLVVDSEIYIHSEDYDRDSFEESVKIESIVGNIVTLDKALSFIPQLDDMIEKSNFKDDGFPYLVI